MSQGNFILEQLSGQPVPERPREFRRRLHERINARLLAVQIWEVAACVLPYACIHFLVTLLAGVIYSITGRDPQKGDDHAERNDKNH